MNCICTLYTDNFSTIAALTTKSFERFASLNGFDFVCYTELFDPTLHPSWNKLHAIMDCFSKGYERVLWSDADSFFVNNHNFYWGETSFSVNIDGNGICLSHMFVENTAYNRRLLETLLFLGDVKDWKVFGEAGIKWEQNALKALINSFNIKVDIFPPYLVNDYGYAPFDERNQFIHVWDRPGRTDLLVQLYNKFYPTP